MSIDVRFGKKSYRLYEVSEADTLGIRYREDWRNGLERENVLTDTGYVVPILRRGTTKSSGDWIRTPGGTYLTRDQDILGHERRENIWSFSGNKHAKSITKRVRTFARMYARTGEVLPAFKIAFPKAHSERYMSLKGAELLRDDRVMTIVQDERIQILKDLGVDLPWHVKELKDIYDDVKKADKIEAKALQVRILDRIERILKELGPKVVGELTETTTEETHYPLDAETEDMMIDGEEQRKRVEQTMTVRVRQEGSVRVGRSGESTEHESGGASSEVLP